MIFNFQASSCSNFDKQMMRVPATVYLTDSKQGQFVAGASCFNFVVVLHTKELF